MTPHALIFDCDGTLADTMPLHWQAWQTIQRRHEFDFPEDRFYSLGGVPSRDILAVLKAERGTLARPDRIDGLARQIGLAPPRVDQFANGREVSDLAEQQDRGNGR